MQTRTKLFEAGVMKWWTILQTCPDSHKLMEQLQGKLGSGLDDAALEIIAATLGTRSPFTVVKRANALLEALRWMAKTFPDRSDIFHEDLAWAYVSALRKAGGAPTKAADFVSALRFATHVMGINSGHLIVSRRVAGLSEQMFAGKRFTQQAKVITVDQMRFLHQLLDSQELCPFDRAVCAYLLIAVYGRCRHSDLACVHDAVADYGEEGGYLEIRTGIHKTGRTAQKKAMLLPILIPAKGVTGTVWMYSAAKAFNAIGLTLDGPINGPLLRPPRDLACSELCVRGLMSKEVTDMMRGLLRLHFSQEQIEGLSSHSAKSTCLSWCAKFGLSEADRSCLGRHTSAVVSSSAIYARDLVIGPVKQLEKVITEIAAGQFVPDASRSDYFKAPHDAEEVACSQAVKEQSFEADSAGPVEEIVQSSDDERGSVSSADDQASDGAQSDVGGDEGNATPAIRQRPVINVEKWFVHKKSRILHLCKMDEATYSEGSRLTACGRRLNSNYEESRQEHEANADCSLCRKRW